VNKHHRSRKQASSSGKSRNISQTTTSDRAQGATTTELTAGHAISDRQPSDSATTTNRANKPHGQQPDYHSTTPNNNHTMHYKATSRAETDKG